MRLPYTLYLTGTVRTYMYNDVNNSLETKSCKVCTHNRRIVAGSEITVLLMIPALYCHIIRDSYMYVPVE